MVGVTKKYHCACAFAKELGEKSPFMFPRVGLVDNVLYMGSFILQHRPTGRRAIVGVTAYTEYGRVVMETDGCCHQWFDSSQKSSTAPVNYEGVSPPPSPTPNRKA